MGPPLCPQSKHFPYNWRNPVMRFTELPQPKFRVATAKIGTRSACLRACWITAVLLALGVRSTPLAAGQEPRGSQATTSRAEGVVTGLDSLADEADRNNPQILAARHAWKAATQVPSQVSTPPDPQITVQQFSVGSPRPFAGFTNSDFAYLGLGISQDLPYPGKLRLRSEVAQRGAAAERERYEAVRRSVIDELKAAYFKLAYEHQELAILDRDTQLLDQITKIA